MEPVKNVLNSVSPKIKFLFDNDAKLDAVTIPLATELLIAYPLAVINKVPPSMVLIWCTLLELLKIISWEEDIKLVLIKSIWSIEAVVAVILLELISVANIFNDCDGVTEI